MPYTHDTTRKFESENFPGVVVILKKMTEGRRLSLRTAIAESQKRIREIVRLQGEIEKQPQETRDHATWLDLQDEYEQIMIETVNPAWVVWGAKQVEGLEAEGRTLGVEDWKDWPSALFGEVLQAIREEAELDGAARKNSGSSTTSGAQEALRVKPSTAEPAKSEGGGETGTASSISLVG